MYGVAAHSGFECQVSCQPLSPKRLVRTVSVGSCPSQSFAYERRSEPELVSARIWLQWSDACTLNPQYWAAPLSVPDVNAEPLAPIVSIQQTKRHVAYKAIRLCACKRTMPPPAPWVPASTREAKLRASGTRRTVGLWTRHGALIELAAAPMRPHVRCQQAVPRVADAAQVYST